MIVPIVATLALVSGCSQVKQAATDAAGGAATQVGKAAADEVKRQICAQVQNQQFSAQNKQVLVGLLPAAQAAGLSAQITTPLDQIARSGDQAPAQAVAALRQTCTSAAPSP